MRRLHRNKAARTRLEELGLTEEQVDTNQDGIVSDEELQAAIELVERQRIDALRALGINAE